MSWRSVIESLSSEYGEKWRYIILKQGHKYWLMFDDPNGPGGCVGAVASVRAAKQRASTHYRDRMLSRTYKRMLFAEKLKKR